MLVWLCMYIIINFQSEVTPKKNNWKKKHEDFINTIRAARGVTAAIKSGAPLPPPPAPTINPGKGIDEWLRISLHVKNYFSQ